MQRGISAPVGTSQGQAFIYDRSDLTLQDPKAPLLLNEYYRQAQAAQASKVKPDAGNMKKFMDDSNEYWYRHEKEMRGEMDNLQNMGAEILAAGVDPFTGVDPASLEFRKKADRVMKLSNYSKQLKELHGEYFKKIDAEGKEGPRYTDASKQAVANYFETPLSDLINGNQEPPRLELTDPAFSILKYDSDMAKSISSSRKDGVEDTDILAFAVKSLEDPQINDAVYTQLQRMDDEGRAQLTAMAQNQGMTPEVYLRYNQMKPHFGSALDSFDFLEVEKQMKPGLSSSSVEKGDVTISSTKLSPKKAEQTARMIVQSNPKYVQAGVKSGRFGSASNTFEENVDAAIEWNKSRLLNEAPSQYGRSEDEGGDNMFGGYSREQFASNRSEWLKAMREGDATVSKEAGDYLKGLTLEDGSTIEGVEFSMPDSGIITLGETNNRFIRLKTVRTAKKDGKVLIERDYMDINPNDASNEYLLRLHDQAFSGPAKKQLFGNTERTVTGPYIPGSTKTTGFVNIMGNE